MYLYKKWVKSLLFYTLLITLLIVLFNALINPYSILPTPIFEGINKVKDNIVSDETSKFYHARQANPNVLLIGTSRTEHMNPKDLSLYEKGKIFNLAIKGSGISTQYKLIRYFIKYKEIKTIVLGLDFFAFNPASMQAYKNLEETRYNNDFFKDYKDAILGVRTFKKSIATFKDNLAHKEARLDYKTGWDSYNDVYQAIKTEGDSWLKNRVESAFPNFGIDKLFFDNEAFKKPSSMDEGLEILDKIVKLCQDKNIKLLMFTTPIYYRVHDVIKERGYKKSYDYWKNHLKSYKRVYDFSYKNSITKNYKNYIDGSHYQHKVGTLIIKRLYHDEQDVPKDFGKKLLRNGEQ